MNNNLKMFYDQEADVLYVTKGHPKYTDYVEYGDNVILRFHPGTKDLVGFTITDFSMSFKKHDSDIQLPFRVNFEMEKELAF
ncbi:DUF2283 domain-containing protein [candidate division KSB1 bacterium]|nr:DUF2283 domain-containing protein [candidate division KSB1 bacterium]MBL7095517.1 DUF2283 domain-containing protein [candidate division KSB1 bacterium]